jgi:hypothetical protein
MSVVIGDLKYQNDIGGLGDKLKQIGGFWEYFTYIEGYKNKATVSEIKLTADNLTPLSCHSDYTDIPELEAEINGRAIPIRDRQLKVSICRDTLKGTYLVNRLSKGANNREEQLAFLEDIEEALFNDNKKFLAEDIAAEIYNQALVDTNVNKVEVTPITDAASAFYGVHKMIDGLTDDQIDLIYDETDGNKFKIFVPSRVMFLLHSYFDNVSQDSREAELTLDNKGLIIRGVEIRAWNGLIGSKMIFTSLENIAVFVDAIGDFEGIRVIPKDEANTDLLVVGMNLGSSYISHELVTVSY